MLSVKALSRNRGRKDPLFIIVISIIICSVLTVYPLSYAWAGWRPLFMLMVTLFWVICQPTWCGVWFAFAIGIFTDLLLDAPLGLNALSYVFVSFVTRYFIRERRIMTFGNTWVIATIVFVAHLIFIMMAQLISGFDFSIGRHWQSLATSIVLWPVLYYFLKPWRI
ncbi:rod shape-determining protein MreD [Acinetobacter shaoyimingii]|uniref:Rod shape-determining protein MreD n=1 Tax=Acinetobacter shaoyimingii TaxID=2715164 RepID=A0A6G8RXG2_9GAMM|nr:rod shape-determining protein MreD [Acinetobacter shaoyimingii]QIO06632.1 rod shape-determining protein MreD [Acinetobacter shaoyimingii]